MTETTFTPTDKALEAFKRMSDHASDQMIAQFFDIWEAEGDPRRAGSMAAHAYIRNAARLAVFGAHCAGVDPEPEMWRACCEDALTAALHDVPEAFAEAATIEHVRADNKKED